MKDLCRTLHCEQNDKKKKNRSMYIRDLKKAESHHIQQVSVFCRSDIKVNREIFDTSFSLLVSHLFSKESTGRVISALSVIFMM